MQFKERGEWRHGNEYSTQTPKKSTIFSGQNLCNRSTLDIGVLGYIDTVWPKEHSPEVWSVPPVTPCIVIPNLFIVSRNSVYWISRWPHSHQIMPKLTTPYKRLRRPGILCSIDWSLVYWRFETTCQPRLQGPNRSKKHSSRSVWPFKMGPIGCPEMSVTNYHSTLHNIPEEQRSHLHPGENLKLGRPGLEGNLCAVLGFWGILQTCSFVSEMFKHKKRRKCIGWHQVTCRLEVKWKTPSFRIPYFSYVIPAVSSYKLSSWVSVFRHTCAVTVIFLSITEVLISP